MKPVLLLLECVYESPGDLVKKQQNSVGLRFCISDKLPGDLSSQVPRFPGDLLVHETRVTTADTLSVYCFWGKGVGSCWQNEGIWLST